MGEHCAKHKHFTRLCADCMKLLGLPPYPSGKKAGDEADRPDRSELHEALASAYVDGWHDGHAGRRDDQGKFDTAERIAMRLGREGYSLVRQVASVDLLKKIVENHRACRNEGSLLGELDNFIRACGTEKRESP